MYVSLIVSTYNRLSEFEKLLSSLVKQIYTDFEVIVIDQNDIIDLIPVIDQYSSQISIKHHKVDFRGLSRSKNEGLRHAIGDVFTFPDDDCTFYPDTVQKVVDFYEEYPNIDLVYGSVYDRSADKNIMRTWSKSGFLKLDKRNFHLNYSAITCFSKIKDFFFDERFGVGSTYNLGEELDYLIRALNDFNVVYSSSIQVWHPELNVAVMTEKKVKSYAFGYGAVCSKHSNKPFIMYMFLKSISYQVLMMLRNIVLFKFKDVRKRYFAFTERIRGFFSYSSK